MGRPCGAKPNNGNTYQRYVLASRKRKNWRSQTHNKYNNKEAFMKSCYVFAVEKFKEIDVVGLSKHYTRKLRNVKEKCSKNNNVDFTRSENNLTFGVKNSDEFEEKLTSIIRKDNDKQILKSNTNLFLGFVISASPNYFFDDLTTEDDLKRWDNLNVSSPSDRNEIKKIWQSLNKNRFEEWKKGVIGFANDDEFKDLIVSFDVHMDEKTPHAHITIVPKGGSKLDCKNFYTPASLQRWRNKLEGFLMPLGLERTRDEFPGVRDDQEQYYKAQAGATQPEQAPVVAVPARMLPNSITQISVPFVPDIAICSKKELKALSKNFKEREAAQGKKYAFYKKFYDDNKFKSAYAAKIENKYNAQKEKIDTLKKQIKKYSDEQMENFRQISLLDVVAKLGLICKKESSSLHRIKNENINLVINSDKNQFSENKNSQNGFGAINLLVKVFGYSSKQAIEFLANDFAPEQITKTILLNPELTSSVLNQTVEKINAELPAQKDINLPAIKNYLINDRGISKEIVNKYLNDGLIYADRKNNLIFTNKNKTFGLVRGTVKLKNGLKNTFKCNKGLMDFIQFQNEINPKNLYVFESAIDALAYQTLNTDAKGLFVSINGSAMSNRMAELNPDSFSNVFACFDNDDQGGIFTDKLRNIVSDENKFTVKISKEKDFGEDAQKAAENTATIYI
jgi:hypothetical protein